MRRDPAYAARPPAWRRTVVVRKRRFGEVLVDEDARAVDEDVDVAGLDPAAAAHFIHTAIRGMRISAKAGADAAQLGATVDVVIAALKARAAPVAEV